MNKKKFTANILARFPEFSCIDGYFYLRSVDHILSGFCCEFTPRHAYIWKFIFPCFTQADISLTFSTRLTYPAGYINFDNVLKENIADEFAKRIEGHIDSARSLLTVESFIKYIEENYVKITNTHIKISFAFALILCGQTKKAEVLLIEALDTKEVNNSPQLYEDVNKILILIKQDVLEAINLLMMWEKQKKELIGITN